MRDHKESPEERIDRISRMPLQIKIALGAAAIIAISGISTGIIATNFPDMIGELAPITATLGIASGLVLLGSLFHWVATMKLD